MRKINIGQAYNEERASTYEQVEARRVHESTRSYTGRLLVRVRAGGISGT